MPSQRYTRHFPALTELLSRDRTLLYVLFWLFLQLLLEFEDILDEELITTSTRSDQNSVNIKYNEVCGVRRGNQ